MTDPACEDPGWDQPLALVRADTEEEAIRVANSTAFAQLKLRALDPEYSPRLVVHGPLPVLNVQPI